MAPEQARGEPVDRRADIWSFGVVRFEMLAGRRPFEGRTVSDTLASVLAREPDLDALPTDVPPALRRLLRRCLEKEPDRRLRDIAEGMLQLDDGLAEPPAETPTAATVLRWWQRPVPAVLAALLAAGLGGVAVLLLSTPAPEVGAVKRFELDLTGVEPIRVNGMAAMPAVSPDGTTIAYGESFTEGEPELYLRRLDQLDARALTESVAAYCPFFSPDSDWLGYFDTSARQLRRVSLSGGGSLTIAPAFPPLGASWLDDGTILFAAIPEDGASARRVVMRVAEAGGVPAVVAGLDPDADYVWPRILPGGSHFLVTSEHDAAGDIDEARVEVGSLETGERRLVLTNAFNAFYVPTGHLLFGRQGALWAVPFDLDRLEPTGTEVVVLQDLQSGPGGSGQQPLALSPDGLLLYVSGTMVPTARTLVWVDREGNEEPLGVLPRAYDHVRLSPDGTRVALSLSDEEEDVWVWDLARSTLTRVTSSGYRDSEPDWWPDGRRLLYTSPRGGDTANLFAQAADGTGEVEQVTSEQARVWVSDIDDGRGSRRPTTMQPRPGWCGSRTGSKS